MRSLSKLFAFAVCVGLWSQGGAARAAEIRLGNMKAERILFLGNSITAVPQQNLPIWWGLSASTVAKDYVHLLVHAVDAKTGGHLALIPTTAHVTNADGSVDPCEANVINIADVFERGYATYNASKIKKQLAWKADIVDPAIRRKHTAGDLQRRCLQSQSEAARGRPQGQQQSAHLHAQPHPGRESGR